MLSNNSQCCPKEALCSSAQKLLYDARDTHQSTPDAIRHRRPEKHITSSVAI